MRASMVRQSTGSVVASRKAAEFQEKERRALEQGIHAITLNCQ